MNTPTSTSNPPEPANTSPAPRRLGWLRRSWGGLLAFTGFMLSPLSWWNDLIVNVPLALAFAWVVALFYPPAFEAAVVIGYALTNVLGFVMLHVGLGTLAGQRSQRRLARDLGLAVLYTAVVLGLVHLGMLKPIAVALADR